MGGRGQWCLIFGVGAGALCLLMAIRGSEQTWRLWGIPAMTPHFADARVILSGLESRRDGYNPLVDNPRDPWKRPMNYPRVWLLLGSFQLDQRHTTAMGLLFIAAFALGLCLMSAEIDRSTAWLLAVCAFSPAVLFGVERANNDLLMFLILALALTVLQRSRLAALTLVGVGTLLKLFPFLGITMFLRVPRREFLRLLWVAVGFGVLYAFLTIDDLYRIREVTPQSVRLAYGANVVWASFQVHFSRPLVAWSLVVTSYIAVVLACVAAIALRRHTMRVYGPARSDHLDAFRVGSAVYLGSFVLFVNWDYRLMFLLFTLPALAGWARERRHPIGRIARVALPAIVFSCWSLGMHGAVLHTPRLLPLWFLIEQAAKWVAFVALLCAYAYALPEWHYPRIILQSPPAETARSGDQDD